MTFYISSEIQRLCFYFIVIMVVKDVVRAIEA